MSLSERKYYYTLTNEHGIPFPKIKVGFIPVRYQGKPTDQIYSARTQMSEYWHQGGDRLVKLFQDSESREKLMRIPWGDESSFYVMSLRVVRRCVRDTSNSVTRAHIGLNVGIPIDNSPQSLRLSHTETLQLMIGALALDSASTAKSKKRDYLAEFFANEF